MLQIKALQNHQFSQFLNALKLENWDVEELQLDYLYKEFKDDFFIATMNEETIGFVVGLRYSSSFGFISNFVILKKFRSLGYGTQLFEFAQSHLEDSQIALECEKNQESFYAKHSFKTYYASIYYTYTLHTKLSKELSSSNNVSSNYDKDLVFAYNEARVFTKYASYLHLLIEDKETLFRAIYTQGSLSSYAIAFKYKDGYKLVISASNTQEIAMLFFALIENHEVGTLFYIEVLEIEKSLLEFAGLLKMQEVSRMCRMYNKIL